MLLLYNRIRLSLSTVNRTEIKYFVRNHTITKCFSFEEKRIFRFCHYVLWCNFIFQYFYFKFLTDYLSRWYNLYCYAFFHFFTKVYSAKYFLDEIQKHDTDFSINFHYYCLLFLMLLKWYATVDLKICQNIRLH